MMSAFRLLGEFAGNRFAVSLSLRCQISLDIQL